MRTWTNDPPQITFCHDLLYVRLNRAMSTKSDCPPTKIISKSLLVLNIVRRLGMIDILAAICIELTQQLC